MVHSVELIFDDDTDVAIRQVWDELMAAGADGIVSDAADLVAWVQAAAGRATIAGASAPRKEGAPARRRSRLLERCACP